MVEQCLWEDGATRSGLRLVDRWSRGGVRVVLYALHHPAPGERSADLPAGVRPLHATTRRDLRLRWALVLGLLRLLPRALRADVVVSGREIGWGLLIGSLAAKATRRPFVVMIRSAPLPAMEHYVRPRLHRLTRWSLRTADRLICISPGLAVHLQELGIDASRVTTVLNGVDVAEIRKAAASEPPRLPGGAGPLVVGVGRLSRQKGFDLLVQAHARVLAAGVPHRLLLLGEGEDRDRLQLLADELGVSSSVHLPGFVARALPVMAAADLYCMPSRWEGFGQTLAEAMIVETPVVAADCVSGPRYLLDGGRYGDLVPVDDVAALAAAVERHLRQPARLQAAAAAGCAWAGEHLDVGRTADEVLDVLHDVVAGRAGARPDPPAVPAG